MHQPNHTSSPFSLQHHTTHSPITLTNPRHHHTTIFLPNLYSQTSHNSCHLLLSSAPSPSSSPTGPLSLSSSLITAQPTLLSVLSLLYPFESPPPSPPLSLVITLYHRNPQRTTSPSLQLHRTSSLSPACIFTNPTLHAQPLPSSSLPSPLPFSHSSLRCHHLHHLLHSPSSLISFSPFLTFHHREPNPPTLHPHPSPAPSLSPPAPSCTTGPLCVSIYLPLSVLFSIYLSHQQTQHNHPHAAPAITSRDPHFTTEHHAWCSSHQATKPPAPTNSNPRPPASRRRRPQHVTSISSIVTTS